MFRRHVIGIYRIGNGKIIYAAGTDITIFFKIGIELLIRRTHRHINQFFKFSRRCVLKQYDRHISLVTPARKITIRTKIQGILFVYFQQTDSLFIVGAVVVRRFAAKRRKNFIYPTALHIILINNAIARKEELVLLFVRQHFRLVVRRYSKFELAAVHAGHLRIKFRFHGALKIKEKILAAGMPHTIKFLNMIDFFPRRGSRLHKIVILNTGRLHIIFFYRNQLIRNNFRRHTRPRNQIYIRSDVNVRQ